MFVLVWSACSRFAAGRLFGVGRVRGGVKLSDSLSHQQFCGIRLGNQREQRLCVLVDFSGFCCAEILGLAPFSAALCKSIQTEFRNTIHMPGRPCKIHPLPAAVRARRADKQRTHLRMGLLQQGNQVVGAGSVVLAGQLELTAINRTPRKGNTLEM